MPPQLPLGFLQSHLNHDICHHLSVCNQFMRKLMSTDHVTLIADSPIVHPQGAQQKLSEDASHIGRDTLLAILELWES